MEIFWDGLKDAMIDTVYVIPVLYLAYLLVSYFSHNDNEKYSKLLHKTNKAGPVIGSFLGAVPQCGFSSVMSSLYSKKIVTVGTLIAVFIATSDEAIPIMIANPQFIPKMLLLIGIKVAYAIIIGYVIDGLYRLFTRKKPILNEYKAPHEDLPVVADVEGEKVLEALTNSNSTTHEAHDEKHHDHECHHGAECHKAEEVHACGHAHSHSHCCATNIFLDALKHTLIIIAYVFVATLAINLITGYVGLEGLQKFFADNIYLQILLACLVGLIPNCAASVFLTELYISNVLMFPALVAGLTAGAGVGLIVLFSSNHKNVKANILILVGQFIFGLLIGVILSFFPF